MDEQHIKNIISNETCSRCGGEADGWKCPKCRGNFRDYDPLHRQKCSGSGKMRLKCKKCGEVEDNCTCR